MGRLKNFSRNLATSYLQMAVNVGYSLVSVPIILHWLPEVEFGLWAVLLQFMLYLNLIDLGINQAISRFLVDHKDEQEKEDYGALLKISLLVSIVQGAIVFLVIMVGSPWLAQMMKIPPQYHDTFVSLMRMQGAIGALTFCANPLMAMLYAHQRMDIPSRQSIYGMVVSFGLLVLFLFRGCGLYAFVYANAVAAVMAPCHYFWSCHRLGFFPAAGKWGRISWKQFQDVFWYGRDVFLMNVGAYLITASQVVIITATLGLKAAALWSVGTKIFSMVRYFMFQPYATAVPGLSEMHARKESAKLQSRFQSVVVLGASLGAYLSVSYVLCNSLFIHVWTAGRMEWPAANDVFLGLWLFFTSFQMTHCNFVTVTKEIGAMRYLYFGEGIVFVVASLLLGYRWGLPGIIVCSVACVFLFSYLYGLHRSARYFHTSFYDLALQWVAPSLKLAAIYSGVAVVTWFCTPALPILWRLVVHAAVATLGGGLLFLRFGLPRAMIHEAQARLPQAAASFLDRLLPGKRDLTSAPH